MPLEQLLRQLTRSPLTKEPRGLGSIVVLGAVRPDHEQVLQHRHTDVLATVLQCPKEG